MDIRTKLVFALVAVALASMLTLGGITYSRASLLIREATLDQLDAVAASKKEAIEKLVDGWHERVGLIASRTQLRESLSAWADTGTPDAPARIRRILADALGAGTTVESLVVHDMAGRAVASVHRAGEVDTDPGPEPAAGSEYRGIHFTEAGEPRISFVRGLDLERERLGLLHVIFNAQDLIDLTRNYDNLGQTGEVMIVVRERPGVARVLHPVRHARAGPPGPLRLEGQNDPANIALRGNEDRFWRDVTDYRGESVWAATRFVPETGWGVVIKFDREEELTRILQFRYELGRLGLSLAAFAILLGTVLGFRFAKPIHDLASVADRIRRGELKARATIRAEDEVGLLARTFNEMAAELERRVAELHEFHTFFEVALDLLCIAGTDGYFKRTNPAFERTLGWSPEELLSKPFFDFVHPDDVAATRREVEKLATGIPTVSFENRYRCADGSYRHLLWTSHPETETGLLYAAARDITELKRAQQQLLSAVRSSPAPMIMVDAAGTIVMANESAEQLLGYEAIGLAGTSIDELVPDDVRAKHAAHRAEFLREPTAKPMRGRELRARKRDGSEIAVEIGLSPVEGSDGAHVLASLIDLSPRKRAEQEAREARSQLEAALARLRELS